MVLKEPWDWNGVCKKLRFLINWNLGQIYYSHNSIFIAKFPIPFHIVSNKTYLTMLNLEH